MMKLRYLVPLVAVLAGTAQAGAWNVAIDSSSVGFTGEQQGSKFSGRFERVGAMSDFDPASPSSGSVTGSVETESVNTRDYDRDATLAEADWFDPANHPEATFESTSIEPAADGMFVAHGNLTIKGKTRPADMSFSFSQDGDTAMFDGKLSIDRFDFNVGEGWNDTSWVGQNVDVEIKLELSR